MANLRRAVDSLPLILVFDNSDLARPCRPVAVIRIGQVTERPPATPPWLERILGR
jgi:hypothetical protein